MQIILFGIPIHFCQHEAMMLLGLLGSIPFVGRWLWGKILAAHKKGACEHDHPKSE